MNWKTHHWVLLLGGGAIALGLTFAAAKLDGTVHTGAAYKAKVACSEVFLAGRERETVLKNEFENIDPFLNYVRIELNDAEQHVTANGPLGFGLSRAVYRNGYGCTLQNKKPIAPLPAIAPVASEPWDEAKTASAQRLNNVDYDALNRTINEAFNDNPLNHRALLVAVDGKIVAEHYADEFSQETPFASWSMAKSVTATILGAAVMRGLVDIDDPAPVPEWRSDPKRSAITWNNLLQMQSGLDFDEDYGGTQSDVNRMLFHAPSAGGYAADKPAIHSPGEHWAYSSGTTNVVARALRRVLEDAGTNYHEFARETLYGPIGAASIIMETDASGSSIGSSYIYATARDWARLGELYLRGGEWNGERLLPKDWPAYVATPAKAADNQYGAHFWLNRAGENGRAQFLPGLPEDLYFMSGHEGQFVFIIPARNMVIVRTGIIRGEPPLAPLAPLITSIYEAVGELDDNVRATPAQ